VKANLFVPDRSFSHRLLHLLSAEDHAALELCYFCLDGKGCGKHLTQVRMAELYKKWNVRRFEPETIASRLTSCPKGRSRPAGLPYIMSRHEKRVAQHLSQREIEFCLPLYKSARTWADESRVTLDLPLFPGYLPVHIRHSERGRAGRSQRASVVSGTGGEPTLLPDVTIDVLRSGLEARLVQPHSLLTVGQRVRIRSGALAGFEVIVVRNRNSFRVALTVEYIMQSYAVEVALEDLELLEPGELLRGGKLQ